MFNNRFFIAGLFAAVLFGTIMLTVIGGFAVSAVGSYGVKPAPVQPAPVQRRADAMRVELNSALAPEFPFNFETVGNPFADTSGVSLAQSKETPPGAVSPFPNAVTPGNAGSFPKSALPKSGGGMMPPPNNAANYPNNGFPPLASPQLLPPGNQLPAVNTGELLKERQRQAKLGKDVPAIPTYYGIDELRPFGVVGSGSNNKVKLYAAGTNSRFSVSKGTRFRDGTIESIGDEGVQFRRDNGEVVFHRWMKNKGKTSGSTPSDAPVLRVDRPQITERMPR